MKVYNHTKLRLTAKDQKWFRHQGIRPEGPRCNSPDREVGVTCFSNREGPEDRDVIPRPSGRGYRVLVIKGGPRDRAVIAPTVRSGNQN
jgi:hypothetical protein